MQEHELFSRVTRSFGSGRTSQIDDAIWVHLLPLPDFLDAASSPGQTILIGVQQEIDHGYWTKGPSNEISGCFGYRSFPVGTCRSSLHEPARFIACCWDLCCPLLFYKGQWNSSGEFKGKSECHLHPVQAVSRFNHGPQSLILFRFMRCVVNSPTHMGDDHAQEIHSWCLHETQCCGCLGMHVH